MGPGPLALIWSPDSRGASYCLPALYIQESRKLQTQHRRSNIPLRATGARWRISQRFILLEVVGVATVILALGACGLGLRAALLATTSAGAVLPRSAIGSYLPYLRARGPLPGSELITRFLYFYISTSPYFYIPIFLHRLISIFLYFSIPIFLYSYISIFPYFYISILLHLYMSIFLYFYISRFLYFYISIFLYFYISIFLY